MNILSDTVYWGVVVSIASYLLGKFLQDKFKIVLFNPLLFSTVFTVLFLLVLKVDYSVYYEKANLHLQQSALLFRYMNNFRHSREI